MIFLLSCSSWKHLSWIWLSKGKSFFKNSSLLKTVFCKNNYNADFIRRNTHSNTDSNTQTTTSALALLRQRLYRTSEAPLKLSHVQYNLTIYVFHTLRRLLTNLKDTKDKPEDRQGADEYARSNAATARPLTLVKPAEILARDWLNTNERQEMVTTTITLLNTVYRRNIK